MIKTPNIRFFILFLALFAFFSLLIVQFFRLQILEVSKWKKIADRQHYFVVNEPFLRGVFYGTSAKSSNHPEQAFPLVFDVEMFHLYIDPESIDEKFRDEMAKILGDELKFSSSEKKTLRSLFEIKSRSRKIAEWLDIEEKNQVARWWKGYAKKNKIAKNALFFVPDYRRSYPYGSMLGQILHTVQQLKDEKTKRSFPTGGLELYFNSYLQGKLGQRRLMRSPKNAFDIGEMLKEPQNGADVYLSIDPVLQAIAEEELAKGAKEAGAKHGWAVMINPYTGHILALAQYPGFDPTYYSSYFSDPIKADWTRVKAIQDGQEPGSIMKTITIAMALQANQELLKRGEKELFNPEEKIATAKGNFPGRRKPIGDTHKHDFLNMWMGFQKSSNIYMGRLTERVINRLGAEWMRAFLHDTFGFGEKTGIELPAETVGLLPQIGKKHPNGALEWSTATPFSIAMGHNVVVTGLQMVRAYSVIANGGYLITPTLIKKIVRQKGDQTEVLVDYTERKKEDFPKVLDDSVIKQVVRAMKFSTKTGGTARKADVPGYTDAGKTGTPNKVVGGRYSETLYCPSFIGFTPASNPAFVLLVTLDEPKYGYVPGKGRNHHGGTCSAPIFREIATRALDYLGVPPDDPYGYPYGDTRRNSKLADWSKEVDELKILYEKWNGGGG